MSAKNAMPPKHCRGATRDHCKSPSCPWWKCPNCRKARRRDGQGDWKVIEFTQAP